MTEEFEEEGIVPAGALELETQRGGCAGVGSGNIEGTSPEHGKVGWAVVLAVAGQVLVEDDVEGPVQTVFDAPMGTNDTQELRTTVVLAQQKEALDGFVLAALAGDPCDGFEAWEVVLRLHVLDGHDERTALFLAPMACIGGGNRLLAFARRCGNRSPGVGQQSRLVLLHRQHVIAAPRHDLLGHLAMTVQCVGRHHAALELQKFEQLQGAATEPRAFSLSRSRGHLATA